MITCRSDRRSINSRVYIGRHSLELQSDEVCLDFDAAETSSAALGRIAPARLGVSPHYSSPKVEAGNLLAKITITVA